MPMLPKTARAGQLYRARSRRGLRYVLIDQVRGSAAGRRYVLAHEIRPNGTRRRGLGIDQFRITLTWAGDAWSMPPGYELEEERGNANLQKPE